MSFDWSDVFSDPGLTVTCHLWLPPGPDPLTASNWWAFREPCDCPETSFGRNPHRWDCEQTPAWMQTIRDLEALPSLGIRLTGACSRGPCCLGDGHDGRCRM